LNAYQTILFYQCDNALYLPSLPFNADVFNLFQFNLGTRQLLPLERREKLIKLRMYNRVRIQNKQFMLKTSQSVRKTKDTLKLKTVLGIPMIPLTCQKTNRTNLNEDINYVLDIS